MFIDRTSPLGAAVNRISDHVRLPLFRNGYALLFSGFTTSVLGFAYWALAARLYPAEIVGLSSALLSAMLLLSGMAQLSLNNVLIRFIPVAGSHTSRLLIYAYIASALAAVLLSLLFILGIDRWAPALSFLNSSPQWQWAFVAASTGWCIFSLQDSALAGLRQTVWVPVENTVFAILKILLLCVFAFSIKEAGIFLSWTVPVLLSLLPVNGLIFGRLLPRRAASKDEPATRPNAGQILKYIGGNYVGTLFFLAYTNLLPLIVANEAGAASAAYFYLPWTISGGMQLIAINLVTSMTVEGARNERELHNYCRRVLSQSLRLLVPLVAVIFIGAPFLLNIFGNNYPAEGSTLLRWLSLSAIPNLVVVLALGLARVQNRPALIAVIQGATCVSALSLTYFLLPGFSITGAGIAWTICQTVMALLVGAIVLRPLFGQSRLAADTAEKSSTPANLKEGNHDK